MWLVGILRKQTSRGGGAHPEGYILALLFVCLSRDDKIIAVGKDLWLHGRRPGRGEYNVAKGSFFLEGTAPDLERGGGYVTTHAVGFHGITRARAHAHSM